jgi:hypothetical protein
LEWEEDNRQSLSDVEGRLGLPCRKTGSLKEREKVEVPKRSTSWWSEVLKEIRHG